MRQAAAATAVDPANSPSPSRSSPGNRQPGASVHISDMTSIEPFNRLVKLAARAFYDNIFMKGDSMPKSFGGDNRGIGVVVLDALTRREWVREEDLAKELKLHSRQLRRILCLFEEEKLVTRYHWKESVKGAKAPKVAAAAAGDGQSVTKQGEEKSKMHTHSYCCLDYAQICDVVRYRIHHMKKKLEDELNSRDTIQNYVCHSCNKRYSAFDALQLVSYTDDYFHCENCNGKLAAVSDKFASDEMGGGEDNARKCRSDQLNDMLRRIDEQLKPLVVQLERVKNLTAPEFGSLQSWERANIGAFANGCPGAADSSRNSMPGTDPEYEIKPPNDVHGGDASGKNGTGSKIMPPWMVRPGMNLTEEQRGRIPSKPDEISETKDGNKQKSEDEQSIEDEYIKDHYEAWRKQEEEDAKRRIQHEGEAFSCHSQSERLVGKKYKWEDEGIEGEEDQAAGNIDEASKLEPQESGDDADDGFWVDG